MEAINRALIEACISGDRRAQRQLYMLCFPDLMRVCMRYHKQEEFAAEVLNTGFFKVLTNLDKYPDHVPFISWAKRVVLNSLIDDYRRNKRYKLNISYPEEDGTLEGNQQSSQLDYNEAEQRLEAEDIMKLINQLPEGRREIFLLYAVEGYTHQEIGEMMNIPEGTSKWHVSEARRILKKQVAEKLNYKMVRNGQI